MPRLFGQLNIASRPTAKTPELAWPAETYGFIAQIGDNEEGKGSGFLIAPNYVITCAHVVNACLGRGLDHREKPADTDILDVLFPWGAPGKRYTGTVVAWSHLPAEQQDRQPAVDIAVIKLNAPTPDSVTLRRLEKWGALTGRDVRSAGFPKGYPQGRHAQGRVEGPDGAGWWQTSSTNASTAFMPGHSGAPIMLDATGAVVGMFAMTDHEKGDLGLFIPCSALQAVWPDLQLEGPTEPQPPPHPPPRWHRAFQAALFLASVTMLLVAYNSAVDFYGQRILGGTGPFIAALELILIASLGSPLILIGSLAKGLEWANIVIAPCAFINSTILLVWIRDISLALIGTVKDLRRTR